MLFLYWSLLTLSIQKWVQCTFILFNLFISHGIVTYNGRWFPFFLSDFVLVQKLKAALSQQLPQVTNGDTEQSRAASQTPPPVPPLVPPPVPPVVPPPPAEETRPQSLQQPATSTTETPVRNS